MNYQDTAQQIITLIGGKDNVLSLFHCITRLRFYLKITAWPTVRRLKRWMA